MKACHEPTECNLIRELHTHTHFGNSLEPPPADRRVRALSAGWSYEVRGGWVYFGSISFEGQCE